MDPFETGEGGVLEYEMITAKDLLAMFDGLAQVESVYTRGPQVMVVTRLQEIPLTRPPTHDENVLESLWGNGLCMCDEHNRRIRLFLFPLQSIQHNDVALCTTEVADADIRSDLRCMRGEMNSTDVLQDVLHFHAKTLTYVCRLSLRTALRAWCASWPATQGLPELDPFRWNLRYAKTSSPRGPQL
jgi:hypothetical protein